MSKVERPAQVVARAVGVKTVRTNELSPNPHNPRMLFDEKPMEVLLESISKVGILVPLTVYLDKRKGHYVILDGQRRWMCAQKAHLATVPVQEVEHPTDVQNIVTMFQIHKLREDWQLMPTALKLDVLMKALKETNDAKLAELTGLNIAVVARCKKLLTYPAKYQNRMLDPNPENRLKADFFIELYAVRNDRFVNQMDWFRKDKFTESMLARYESKRFKSVTDFRIIKEHIANARKAKKSTAIAKRLKEFTDDPNLQIDHLDVASARAAATARVLKKQIQRIHSEIAALDIEEYLGEEDLWVALESLVDLIRKKLEAAGRRPAR
jgi:ParB/RepB/Spo0J family partition protein